MTIGGASGATTGGLKIDRILLILRGVGWRLQRAASSSEPSSRRISGDDVTSGRARLYVEAAATLAALWIATLVIGSIALAFAVDRHFTFSQIVFETASALSSVGLSVGITEVELSDAGKSILIVLMWLGRLEIVAALFVIWLPLRRITAIGRR